MKPVCWSHLLPDPMVLNDYSNDKLEAIERTADCEVLNLTLGIAAIGELLAFTADADELEKDTARNIGWLINSLGKLSSRLADTSNGAVDEQHSRKAAAPNPTAEG
ncbi:hypothetical protein [Stutzerimonas nitrititolerans]|uniref:hypothetical protein n=1 Tax=Stutzerimonas nitrititolerans TaxID=2482751 RepID=UPI002898A5D5|nr:hypothetical protein [Stutzerimonas nitrititolerans]